MSDITIEPTLGDVMADLGRAKLYLLAGAMTGLVFAFVFLSFSVPHYRSSMLVFPVEYGAGTDIKTLLQDQNPLAVQYMMNTMEQQDSRDFTRFEHIVRGRSVAARLIEDKRIVEGVEGDRYFAFEGKNKIASAEALSDYLQEHVAIEPVGTSRMLRLVYDHADRQFAGYLLRRIHESADNVIRDEIRSKTNSRTAYLQKALATTEHPDHRRALASLLMEHEHIKMILAMDEPFAAAIAEPPATSVKTRWPRREIILPVFIFSGMLVFYMFYSLRRVSRP